tara:strand:+ start:667 stop:861 length:195 start_codon:yes stop_codon:yes gene_type:complete
MVVSWKHKGIHVDSPKVVYTLDIRIPMELRFLRLIPIQDWFDVINPYGFLLKWRTTQEEQYINT